ncbi:MAG: hypothetical protein ABSA18_17110 [Dehalococcoidia bacterium]|jgi:hypothetical protein
MVTNLAALIERTELKTSDTGIEELVKEIGLTSWSLPYYESGDEEPVRINGIDEELIYSVGYTLGGLPGNIRNNTNEFCNKIVGEILCSDGRISFNELQNKAAIYMIGYQSGLRAR